MVHPQVANTWTKITAQGVYEMVRNREECKNDFLRWLQLLKRQILTFCGSLIRIAELRARHKADDSKSLSLWMLGGLSLYICSLVLIIGEE